jgi:hypothetical protein
MENHFVQDVGLIECSMLNVERFPIPGDQVSLFIPF